MKENKKHFTKCLPVMPGDPGDHGIGVTVGDHASPENITVAVDQTPDIALKIPFAF